MACPTRSIDDKELIKVHAFIRKSVEKSLASGKPFTMDMVKEMASQLYNIIINNPNIANSPTARQSASNYASTIPKTLISVINTAVDPNTGKNAVFDYVMESNFPWNELYSTVKTISDLEPAQRIPYVETWLGIGAGDAQDVIDAQQTSDELERQKQAQAAAPSAVVSAPSPVIIVQDVDVKKLPSEGPEFVAVPPTSNKSAGIETEYGLTVVSKNPKRVFYFKVIRYLQALVSGTANNDSRYSNTQGTNGIYIRFMSPKQLKDLGLLENALDDTTNYYAVPVSIDGDILYFDNKTGENVASPENASPVLMIVPKVGYDKQTNRYYFQRNNAEKYLEKVVRSNARFNGTDETQADAAVQTQMGITYAIGQKLMANPEDMTIIGYVNGGSPGYMAFDAGLKTKVGTVTFKDGPLSYQLKVDTNNSLGNGGGITYLYTDDANNFPLRVWIPLLDSETIDKVTDLFTENIINTINDQPISYEKRSELIEQFVNKQRLNGKVQINYPTAKENSEFTLRINDKRVNLETREQIDEAKAQIREILKNNVYLRVYQNGAITKSYDPVNMEGNKYTPSIASYYAFLEEKGIWINYQKNENGGLAFIQPYVTFGYDMEQLSELAPYSTASVEEHVPVEKRTAVPVPEGKRELLSDYKAKFVFGTPGIGKTYAIGMNEDLVDMDDLLVEEIRKVKGNTTFGVPYASATNEEVGRFLDSLFDTDSNEAELIYDDVLDKAMELRDQGKTVFTGSHRFAGLADIAVLNNRQEDLLVSLSMKGVPVSTRLRAQVDRILASQKAAMESGKVKIVELAPGQTISDVIFAPVETPAAPASDAAKRTGIERRREEKLDKANQRRQKTSQREDARVKVETYRTIDINDNPVEAEITTNKDGSRVLKARLINEDGSVEPMAHFTERINNKAQLSLTNEKIVEAYIGNEGNTLQRTNLDENPDQTYIDKINADSDAEYIDAVKNGKMTREQAMQALEEVGRKDSNAYAELAAPGAAPIEPTPQQPKDFGLTAKDFEEDAYKLIKQKELEVKATPEQIDAAKEWYEKSPLRQFIPFQVFFKAINGEPSAVAKWTRDGVILTKGADFTDYYHEAFHGFIATFMTAEQRRELFEATRKLQGTFRDYDGDIVRFAVATPKQIEEFLAEGFRNYMLNPEKYKFNTKEEKSIFEWLYNILRILFEDVTWDSLTEDSISGGILINELYEQLRVGDLTGYSFQDENTVFDRTPSGMVALDMSDNVNKLGYSTTQEINQSMDSLLSEFIDVYPLLKKGKIDLNQLNAYNRIRDKKYANYPETSFTEEEQKLWKAINSYIRALREKDGGFSIGAMKDKKLRTAIYKYIRQRFMDKIEFYETQMSTMENETAKLAFQKKVDVLNWAVRNYGEQEFLEGNLPVDSFGNVRGVIGYHMLNSDLFDKADKEAFASDIDINEDDIYANMSDGGRLFDENGNNISVLERADADVIYLLNSLYEPGKDEFIPELNTLGFPKLISFDKVWNNMVRLLEGMDDRIDMYNAIRTESLIFPAYKQLLAKIGSPQIGKEIRTSQPGVAPVYEQNPEFNMQGFMLWNKLFQTFGNNFNSPLIQTTIKETTIPTPEGALVKITEKKYNITSGTASAVFKRVGERWESQFSLLIPSPTNFIVRDAEGKNYLDIERTVRNMKRLDYNVKPDDFITFLNSIGIEMDATEGVRNALRSNKPAKDAIIAIYNKLIHIYNYNADEKNKDKIIVPNINTLITTEKGKDSKVVALGSGYKILQELESRYSDLHSNFMVTNAEGNPQYEHTMNSTLTRIVKILNDSNKYPNFKQIMDLPKMSFLNPGRNYWTEVSAILNSLFKLQDDKGNPLSVNDPAFGVRRRHPRTNEYIQIEVNNLSGTALMSDDTWKSGIANASSDRLSKLLSEIHNFANIQTFEVARHSDKQYSYAVGTDYVYVDGAFRQTYVEIDQFRSGGLGMDQAADIISKHISAELKRINRFRTVNEKGLVYDFKYLDRGKDFVLFKDMPVELERKLLALPDDKSLMQHMSTDMQLRKEVRDYIKQWLSRRSQDLQERYKDLLYIDMPIGLQAKGITKANLVDAFIANSIIHNLETLVIIYGDPALYAIEKEEFHKRNSGAGGSGKITATDASAINFVNNPSFNKDGYAKERLGSANIQTRLFDGTLDTAIVDDPIMRSAYYDDIVKHKKAKLEKKGKSEQEINEILYGKDGTHETPTKGGEMYLYANMEVANAQGYISFDAYRMMRALQGRWSWNIQEVYYQRIKRGEQISQDELAEIFPPEKYQYWGHLRSDLSLPSVIAMHKFALIPLIPTAIKENTTLTRLHDKMMREGIHYVTFKTGSKIGNLTTGRVADKIYDNDQSLTIASDFDTREFTKNTIFVEYLKTQVDIAPEFKNNISLASQLRKIIEDGYMANGVPTDFMVDEKNADVRVREWNKLKNDDERKAASKKYADILKYEKDLNNLTESKKEELIEEMGVELNDDGTIKKGMENFIRFVKRELSRREIGNHTINMIGINEKGELKMPMDLSLEADTIEGILNNVLAKRLVKYRVKGEGFIQVSNALFENRDFAAQPGRNFVKPTEEELARYGTIDLPYYRIGMRNGKETVLLAKCKIAMTGDFYNLFYLEDKEGKQIGVYEKKWFNGKQKSVLNVKASLDRLNALLKDEEWLDIGDHRQMVTIAGPRIPVQGMNSAEAFEVYEFLPEEAGPILIPPAEIVAKSGSDFDKDTLFMMTPHIYRVNGKVFLMKTGIKTSFTKDELKEKLRSLRDTRNKLYNELYKGDRTMKNLVKQLTDEERSAFEALYDEYQSSKNELLASIDILKGSLVKNAKGKLRLTTPEMMALENKLYSEYVKLDILEYNYKNNRKQYVGVFKESKIEPINKEIEDLTAQLNSLSSKAHENNVITNYVNFISDVDNFDALTRPNDINIVKPVADELAKFQDTYNGREWLFRDDQKEGSVAATRILEIEYNLYKHESNNVGKQVLGIGAVDNTYNILYNRIGMYMNPYAAYGLSQQRAKELFDKKQAGTLTQEELLEYNNSKIFRQTLFFKHNKLTKFGEEAISLSHEYDADNKYRIGDVISQLINGWVDVAKDAWIFNLQGNKEVGPTLLFLIQAGVPFETAAYFVSQPIIKDYIEQQRRAKSAFGRPLGLSPDQPNMFRNQAKAKMITDPKYGFLSDEILSKEVKMNVRLIDNLYKQKNEIFRVAEQYIPKVMASQDNGIFDIDKLKEVVQSKSKDFDALQRAIFFHFLQVEAMASASTEFKTTTNVDTKKTGTLFSAIDRLIRLNKLEESYRMPNKEMLKKLKDSSPISSFFVQDFQLKISEQLFSVRDSKSAIQFIMDNVNKVRWDVQSTYGEGEDEEFWNGFRNNMISFIFQSQLYDFNPKELTVYRGAAVNKNFSLARVPALMQRVAVTEKDGVPTLYIDLDAIERDFTSNAYAQMDLRATKDAPVPYARLSLNTFETLNSFVPVSRMSDMLDDDSYMVSKPIVGNRETADEMLYRQNIAKRNAYVRFVIEREITRSQIPLSKAKDLYEYQIVLRTTPVDITNRDLVAYEEFLKNRALNNIYNPYHMFMDSKFSMATVFSLITRDFKSLVEQYSVLKALIPDSDKSGSKMRNLRLRSTRLKATEINTYKEELSELSDPNVEKVSNKEANLFISKFFSMLPFYAYIQSGLNSKGKYSLNKIVPPEMFATYMIPFIREYENYLDRNDSQLAFYEMYYPSYVKAESREGRAYNGGGRVKVYSTPFNIEYLDRLDARPADYILKASRKEIPVDAIIPGSDSASSFVFIQENGMYIYKPSYAGAKDLKNFTDYYRMMSSMIKKPKKGGDNIMVHNKLVDPSDIGQMPRDKVVQKPDWLFDHPMASVVNKFGIPTLKYDRATKGSVVFRDSVTADKVAVPNAELKPLIDDAISKLMELAQTNRLIFNNEGYGLELQKTAPVTYLYLSEQLAKLGYANPGIKTNSNAVGVFEVLEEYYQQPITYKEAAELYQKCLS